MYGLEVVAVTSPRQSPQALDAQTRLISCLHTPTMGSGRRVASTDNEVQLPDGFQFSKRLGQGGQGTVLLAHDTRTDRTPEREKPQGLDPARYDPRRVAIKCYPRSWLADPKRRNHVRREIRSLRLLQHPHIIGFREVLLSRTHLCLVIDYAAGGSLHDVLCGAKTQILTEGVARRLFQQLITGVDYAHRKGFTNRDIKPENILFYPVPSGKPPMLVLCDFGLARRDTSGLITTMEGTTGYLAPELFSGHCTTVDQAKHADLYSCGVVLYQMLFGLAQRPPIGPGGKARNRVDMKIMRSWLHGDFKELQLSDLRHLTDECKDFLNRILQPNPRNRIKMEDIWTHPWFRTSLSDEALEWNRKLLAAQKSDLTAWRCDAQVEALLGEACPTNRRARVCTFKQIKKLAMFTKSAPRTPT